MTHHCPDDHSPHTPPCVYDSPGLVYDWTAEAANGRAHVFDDDPDGDGFAPVPYALGEPVAP